MVWREGWWVAVSNGVEKIGHEPNGEGAGPRSRVSYKT